MTNKPDYKGFAKWFWEGSFKNNREGLITLEAFGIIEVAKKIEDKEVMDKMLKMLSDIMNDELLGSGTEGVEATFDNLVHWMKEKKEKREYVWKEDE